MKKVGLIFLISVILVTTLALTFGKVEPDTTKTLAQVIPSKGHATVFIPARAIEVSPDVFYLGQAVDVDGKLVEGYLFVTKKKDNAKPSWAGGGKDKPGTSSCYALYAKGARWKNTELYITQPEIDVALTETSLETWNAEVDFKIFGARNPLGIPDGIDENSPDGKNEVMISDLGPQDTIAYTITWGVFGGKPGDRQLSEWDVMFNSNYNFGDAGPTNEIELGDTNVMDYQNIAVHEFGHAAGLGHPDLGCGEETMHRYAEEGETKKRTLNSGDITGINKLYS